MLPIHTRNRIIGLLGGSFNPAHGGHLHISKYALNKLHCDAVWWLVSPQNPLKSARGMGDYDKRLAQAREVAAADRRIHVSDIEKRIGTRYSVDTIAWLVRRYKGTQFVWLMGADNLVQFHRWRRWPQLLRALPIVVFDRAPYAHRASRSKAALRAGSFFLKNKDIGRIPPTPSLRLVYLKRDNSSSTRLRKELGERPVFGHNKAVR